MAEQPKYFDIEDTETGKRYRIETDDASATYDEAVEYFSTLPETDWQQYEYSPAAAAPKKAGVAVDEGQEIPLGPVANNLETTSKMGADQIGEYENYEVSPLSPADEEMYIRMSRDPSVSFEDLAAWAKSKGGVLTDEAREELETYRTALAEGREVGNTVNYERLGLELLGDYAPDIDPTVDSDFGAALEQGMAYNPMGIATRLLEDLFDTEQGGISKDTIRQQYPDLTDDQIEDIHDNLIGELRRRELINANFQVDARDVNPLVEFAGDIIGGLSPVDLIPFGRGASVGRRLAEAAGSNFVVDAALQGGDIAYGAQNEYDPVQGALAAASGVALQGGVEAIGRGLNRVLSKQADPVSTPRSSTPIAVPRGKKNSKEYKQGLVTAQEQIIDQVNELAGGWTNAPRIEVHATFKTLDGVDDNAIGVYREDGVVAINTERVLERANRLKVSPESVVEAVTFHEALGHHGLTQLFRDDLDLFLADIYNNGSEEFVARVDKWLKDNPNGYANVPIEQRLILATEEVLAKKSEEGLLPRTMIDSLKNLIKDFGRQMGMNLKYTSREVEAYLAVAQSRVTEGNPRTGAPSVTKYSDSEDLDYSGSAKTTSAGFQRRGTDERSKAAARKQLWKNKENPNWDSRDPNGIPPENWPNRKYMLDEDELDLTIKEERGSSYQANGKTVKQWVAYGPDGRTLAVGRRMPFQKMEDVYKRLREDAVRNYNEITTGKTAGGGDLGGVNKIVSNKYMLDDGPIDPDVLSADDLIEARNALDVLNRVDYTPTVIPVDQLEAEIVGRGINPSDVTRLVGMQPGSLVKRLFQYDLAATKIGERVATITADIEANGLNEANMVSYVKATTAFNEILDKLFDLQGEFGRSLAATRRANYTRKRVTGLKEVLKEYNLESLSDPETFMKYMAEMEAQMTVKKGKTTPTYRDNVISAINIPRAIMSSADLSAPMRQGIVFVGYKEYWSSFTKMFSMITGSGERNYKFLMQKIASHPNYELMTKARLAFSQLDGELSAREEDFQTEWARDIPLFGTVVKRSEQAYAGFLNKLRADMFNRFVNDYRKAGVEPDEEFILGLGRFINSATGRAELRGSIGKTEVYDFRKMSAELNATFFSARLMQSRVNMLNPVFYYNLPAPIRKQAGIAMFRFGSTALLVNGALNLLFPEVETEVDPRSADFMKVKVDNTRFDLGGGFNQYLTLGARTASWLYNQSVGFTERVADVDLLDYKMANKKTGGGDYRTFGTKMGQDTYGSALGDFFRSKLSPQMSYFVDAINEKDYIGQPFTVEGSLASRLIPMTATTMYDAYVEDSPVPMPVIFSAALLGVGVNTYTAGNVDPEKELEAPEEFQMSDLADGSNEDIVVKDGVVTLRKGVRDRWQATLTNYYPYFVQEVSGEMGKPFDQMAEDEKKDVVKEATKRARENAKKDMLYELGLTDE